jgi:hypothetical protein
MKVFWFFFLKKNRLLPDGVGVSKINMNTIASPFLNLSAVILGLRVAVAAWGGRRWLDEALVHLVHRRLGEIIRRLEGMVARFQAGTLRPAGVREAGDRGVVKPRSPGTRLWPGKFGWLVRAAAWEAAGFGCQLRAVLETPEMVAFLAACPQAIRVLTPVGKPGVKVARVRTVPEKPDLGRVPIPRGAMAWVRRDRAEKR